jgi:hypothetical protein
MIFSRHGDPSGSSPVLPWLFMVRSIDTVLEMELGLIAFCF